MTAASPKPSSSISTLVQLFQYAKNYRAKIYRATTYSVVNKLFDIAPEILIGMAIDVVVNKEVSFLGTWFQFSLTEQLIVLGVLTFIIWASESFFEFLYQIEWRYLAQKIQHDLRCSAYAHVQKLETSEFEMMNTGQWVSILNDDINQMERFLDNGANSLVQVFTTVIAVGAVFFFLSPLIALFAFLPIPVILLGAFYFQKKATPLYGSVREKAGRLGARLTGNLSGIQTIKSFTAEARELELLTKDSQEYVTSNSEAIRVSSAFIPIIRIAILTGFLATLILGGWLTLRGTLNVGSYGVLVFLTQRLLWPLTRLAETVDLFERAMASTRRVFDLMSKPVEKSEGSLKLDKIEGQIAFDKVSFSYPTRAGILSNITLRLNAGKTYAFVGPTGSGKSSIVKLLLRFYPVSSGNISIDDQLIDRFDLSFLRSQIGLVSQDVFLFQGSIAENIFYGNPEATEEQMKQAAHLAGADEFILNLPNGFDQIIGERGLKLSGGQRQRISLARAILKDPQILILDEATSAVDNETESLIQKSLEYISKNRTVIVIAHRLSTIVNAEKIFVVENGKISQHGTHLELQKTDGTYRRLWNVQTGATKHLNLS